MRSLARNASGGWWRIGGLLVGLARTIARTRARARAGAGAADDNKSINGFTVNSTRKLVYGLAAIDSCRSGDGW